MDASNRIIQSLWVGRPLSTMERLCIQSFLANGHEFHLYNFGNVGAVPAGTVLKDAREILSEDSIFKNPHMPEQGGGTFTAFSNLFRAKLLFERGGWWVDLDMVCLKPFDFPQSTIAASSDEFVHGIRANCNVLKSSPGDPLVLAYLEEMRAVYRVKGVRHAVGPNALHRILEAMGRFDVLQPPLVFNPINWRLADVLIRPPMPIWHPRFIKRLLVGPRINERFNLPETYAVHLWHEMWRREGFDPNATFHPRSPYERLKRRYLPIEKHSGAARLAA